ncbi:MAG: 30S ribosomal protein S14 [Candidatus Diapherotrites archaeon]|nr:30S ribosomal protein S14 [Candidatus Diapherotrites archaeon]
MVKKKQQKGGTKQKGKKVPKGTKQRQCRICRARRGIIHRYGLHICRRCFREQAESMGFKKY